MFDERWSRDELHINAVSIAVFQKFEMKRMWRVARKKQRRRACTGDTGCRLRNNRSIRIGVASAIWIRPAIPRADAGITTAVSWLPDPRPFERAQVMVSPRGAMLAVRPSMHQTLVVMAVALLAGCPDPAMPADATPPDIFEGEGVAWAWGTPGCAVRDESAAPGPALFPQFAPDWPSPWLPYDGDHS